MAHLVLTTSKGCIKLISTSPKAKMSKKRHNNENKGRRIGRQERERQRETETVRERQTERDRQRDRERDRERDRDRDRERQRETERQTKRERDRERERQREISDQNRSHRYHFEVDLFRQMGLKLWILGYTGIWEMFVVEIFHGAGKPRKLNIQIFVYNIHFVCLIFMGCHNPQKYFNMKISRAKNSTQKFSKIR